MFESSFLTHMQTNESHILSRYSQLKQREWKIEREKEWKKNH